MKTEPSVPRLTENSNSQNDILSAKSPPKKLAGEVWDTFVMSVNIVTSAHLQKMECYRNSYFGETSEFLFNMGQKCVNKENERSSPFMSTYLFTCHCLYGSKRGCNWCWPEPLWCPRSEILIFVSFKDNCRYNKQTIISTAVRQNWKFIGFFFSTQLAFKSMKKLFLLIKQHQENRNTSKSTHVAMLKIGICVCKP